MMVDEERLLRLAEKADSLDDPVAQKLLAVAEATPNDYLRKQILKAIGVKAAQHQAHPFHSVQTDGEITIGVSEQSGAIRLGYDDLNRHMLIVGQTGSGKTTLFYNLIDQLDIPWWAFDLKRDYRHLLKEQDDLVILPWSKLRFNPLKPPDGVRPLRWVQVFADVFGHASSLLSGSKNYLMRRIVELYQMYDVDDTGRSYPSLHELEKYIKTHGVPEFTRVESNYWDRVLNRIQAINLTAGEIFDCSHGFPLEELLDRNIVFEFDGLGRDVQNLLMESIFAYIFEYRLANGHRNTDLQHVFLLDEGKRIFSVYKERQDASGIPEIDDLTAKMREFGEGLVVADQESTKLTESIKANTYTTVMMGMGDHNQFTDIADSIGLSKRQREIAEKLAIGEAIVHIGNEDPVPVSIPYYDLEKDVSNEDLVADHAREWAELSYRPRYSHPHITEPRYADNILKTPRKSGKQGQVGSVDIGEEAEHILKDVVDNPFRSVTERYDIFSTTRKGIDAKDDLVKSGLVREKYVRTENGRIKLLELTENGRGYLSDQGVDVTHEGRGGIVHRYWQNRFKEALEDLGWAASLEKHDADVFAEHGDRSIAVEVAMEHRDREVKHVAERVDDFDRVWIACRNEVVMDALRDHIREEGLLRENVRLMVVRDVEEIEDLSL